MHRQAPQKTHAQTFLKTAPDPRVAAACFIRSCWWDPSGMFFFGLNVFEDRLPLKKGTSLKITFRIRDSNLWHAVLQSPWASGPLERGTAVTILVRAGSYSVLDLAIWAINKYFFMTPQPLYAAIVEMLLKSSKNKVSTSLFLFSKS